MEWEKRGGREGGDAEKKARKIDNGSGDEGLGQREEGRRKRSCGSRKERRFGRSAEVEMRGGVW